MTTPRDLMIIAVDVAPGRPLEQGDLSLALAGAELIDLLAAGTIRLDGAQVMPGDQGTAPSDHLLDEAAASIVRKAPYESVADWLWRRGNGLASTYLASLEAEKLLTRQRRRWAPFRTGRLTLTDSLDRRRARERWASKEPVFSALATAAGIGGAETRDAPTGADDAVEIVLAAAHDAVRELEAMRQRRAIEQAAFDNVWRGD
ncbi:GOLPH3/VPS74 family protein [Streptomyces marispadix]|uniref:GPP34 family phosphoprotein n=1 Tax=Streptomyces marispadix TaxID=2922868 RepID=A0ABS9T5K3_9ACTN|nr:GPP34 family phosphoprotein [Streptomyces marispadix]MCH6163831.1 GPP34 family phosphoprotein [Streptomyces marispadix]